MTKIKLPLVSKLPKSIRKITVLLAGAILIVLGSLLVVLPGPFTMPLIFAGVAILSTEFAWAEKAYQKSFEGAKITGRFLKHPIVLAFTLTAIVTLIVLFWKYNWLQTLQDTIPLFQ